MLRVITFVALIAVTSAQFDCPAQNRLNSRDNPDDIVIEMDLFAGGDPQNLVIDPEFVITLGPNTLFEIKGAIQPSSLTILSVGLESRLFRLMTLTLSDENDAVLRTERCQGSMDENLWILCQFIFAEGVTGVDKINFQIDEPTLESDIRNLTIEACVETGWCPWGSCSDTCDGTRTRVCECPNPNPNRYVCPDAPTTEPCGDDCCEPETEWGSWSTWSECGGNCGTGNKTRARECMPHGECPDCTGPDDCVCDGAGDEQTMTCDQECTDYFINNELEEFWTKASHNKGDSDEALIGNWIWKSRVHDNVYWWAGLPKDSCCRLYSIEFKFKKSWEVYVDVMKFGERQYEEVEMITKPNDVGGHVWMSSGLIMLPDNVRKVQLYMQPSMGMYDQPQLKDVEVTICCSGERLPCENIVVNNENYDLKIKASKFRQEAKRALVGTGSFWSPGTTSLEYWYAILRNDCCGFFTLQFEVFNTWEVDVAVKEWHSNDYTALTTVNVPMMSDWYTSDVIVLDDTVPEPRDVIAIRLCIWPASSADGGSSLVPKLRNVVIELCCDDTTYSKWGSKSHGGSKWSSGDSSTSGKHSSNSKHTSRRGGYWDW